ncbi:nuclear transport factor 2 family protein [Streptomyces albus]|nr:nuclear transport factor 2 family protein [Streptomyces albus]
MHPHAPPPASGARLAEIHQLYHLQSHLIDGGRAADWAATFTADGSFTSPTYPAPVTGTAALTAFAERFAADCAAGRVTRRHVVSNVALTGDDGAGTLHVQAYLQIVATPEGGAPHTERFTTLTDRVVHDGSGWRIAARVVHRDGTPASPGPDIRAPRLGCARAHLRCRGTGTAPAPHHRPGPLTANHAPAAADDTQCFHSRFRAF